MTEKASAPLGHEIDHLNNEQSPLWSVMLRRMTEDGVVDENDRQARAAAKTEEPIRARVIVMVTTRLRLHKDEAAIHCSKLSSTFSTSFLLLFDKSQVFLSQKSPVSNQQLKTPSKWLLQAPAVVRAAKAASGEYP